MWFNIKQVVDEWEISLETSGSKQAKVLIYLNVFENDEKIAQDCDHPALLCHFCRLLGGRLASLHFNLTVADDLI